MNRSLTDRLARLEHSVGIKALPADRQAAVERAEQIFKAAGVAHAAVRAAQCGGQYTMPRPTIEAFPEEADRLLVELRALTLEVGPAWRLRRERLLHEASTPAMLSLEGQTRGRMRQALALTIDQLRKADDDR